MADRRPLATPFATSPDADPDAARTFVKQEPGGPAPAADPAPEPRRLAARVLQPAERPSPESRPPAEARAMPPARTKKRRATAITPVAPVPVTVRLRPEVAGGLKRASLERQLAGEELFTQQDIVETLLEPWLHEQGYLE